MDINSIHLSVYCIFHSFTYSSNFYTMVSTNFFHQKTKSLNLVDQIFQRETAFQNVTRSPSLWTHDFLDNTLAFSSTFYYKDLLGHYGCVNSVEFSPDGNFLASGGDDKRILLWNVWDSVHGIYSDKYFV